MLKGSHKSVSGAVVVVALVLALGACDLLGDNGDGASSGALGERFSLPAGPVAGWEEGDATEVSVFVQVPQEGNGEAETKFEIAGGTITGGALSGIEVASVDSQYLLNAEWIYADRAVTIKGSAESEGSGSPELERFRINLAGGWNLLIIDFDLEFDTEGNPSGTGRLRTGRESEGTGWVLVED